VILAVTGGRNNWDRERVDEALTVLLDRNHILALHHGGATGIDQLAAEWATRHGIPVVPHLPDWDLNGRAAGPIRNFNMLTAVRGDAQDLGAAWILVAFTGGKGTRDCIDKALSMSFIIDGHYGEPQVPPLQKEE